VPGAAAASQQMSATPVSLTMLMPARLSLALAMLLIRLPRGATLAQSKLFAQVAAAAYWT
jgi:hypothetical protein